MNTKKIKQFLPIIFLLLIIVPIFVNAADPIIPCGGYIFNADGNKIGDQLACGYYDLLQLVNNIIKWIIMISFPVAAGVFAWAGLKYMTTGISDQKAAARSMLTKVFIGFVFILAAWIIVTTITNTLLSPEFKVDPSVEGVK